MTTHDKKYYAKGEPCSHAGCLSHITHPCEGCGRIAGGLLGHTSVSGQCRKCGADNYGHEVDSIECYQNQVRILAHKLAEMSVADFKEHNQLVWAMAELNRARIERDAAIGFLAGDGGDLRGFCPPETFCEGRGNTEKCRVCWVRHLAKESEREVSK